MEQNRERMEEEVEKGAPSLAQAGQDEVSRRVLVAEEERYHDGI